MCWHLPGPSTAVTTPECHSQAGPLVSIPRYNRTLTYWPRSWGPEVSPAWLGRLAAGPPRHSQLLQSGVPTQCNMVSYMLPTQAASVRSGTQYCYVCVPCCATGDDGQVATHTEQARVFIRVCSACQTLGPEME